MIDDDEKRIREKAHELWVAQGSPDGQAERNWAEAKEIIALKDSFGTTLRPLDETIDEPVEPAIAFENQADKPGLTDQGDEAAGPSRDIERETANALPLSVDEDVSPEGGGAGAGAGAKAKAKSRKT